MCECDGNNYLSFYYDDGWHDATCLKREEINSSMYFWKERNVYVADSFCRHTLGMYTMKDEDTMLCITFQ